MEASDLLVLVPSRGRPDSITAMNQAWRDTEARAQLVFCIDSDDPAVGQYLARAGGPARIRIGPRRRLAGTLNEVSTSYLRHHVAFGAIGFFGDDHRPRTKGWDRRFAECLSEGAGIVYGNDLLMRDKMPTAVMMTRDIIATLGHMCPPGLVHLCLDLVWKDWGEGMGRITYLDDVVIEHLHPANGKAEMDAGYEEANSSAQVDTDTKAYLRYRDNGGLAADLVKLKELL